MGAVNQVMRVVNISILYFNHNINKIMKIEKTLLAMHEN